MSNSIAPNVIYEFLSGARVFAKAVRDVEGAVLQEVAGTKLSMPQLKLLYLVAHVDSVTIGDAAAFLGVSSSAASKTVEKPMPYSLVTTPRTWRRISQPIKCSIWTTLP